MRISRGRKASVFFGMKEFLFEVNRIVFIQNGSREEISKMNRRPISLSSEILESLRRARVDRVDLDHAGGRTSITPTLKVSRVSPS